jgi:hypothetical protein
MQFRIRNLLFVTFVIALCGGLMTLSLPAGGIASVPILVALARTIRHDPRSTGNVKPPSLFLTFCHSLALIVALAAVTVLWGVAASFTAVLLIIQLAMRIFTLLERLLQRAKLRVRLVAVLILLYRLITRCLDASYAGARFLAFAVVRRLNRTNRTLYSRWSH